MARNYIDIRKTSPQKGKSYFLDANVWLMLIQGKEKIKPYERAYIDFFEKLIKLIEESKKEDKPKIIVNSLLISETFNAFLRAEFKAYKESEKHRPSNKKSNQEIDKLSFKKDFRPLTEYTEAREDFTANMMAYWEYITWLKEEEAKVDLYYLIENLSGNIDFNDFYYYEVCLENDYFLVTNDGDFQVDGISILTCNNQILRNR